MKKIALLLCFIGFSQFFAHSLFAADRRLRIIELHHQFASDVLPVLRPLLPADSAATAHDNKLIVNISDEELARLQPIIDELDQAAKRLMIYVRQRQDDDSDSQRLRVQADIRNGNVSGNLQSHFSTERDSDKVAQRVQSISGSSAFLQTGFDIPYLTFSYSPLQGSFNTQTQFKQIGAGFFVLARVNGDHVNVQINPRQSMPKADGRIAQNVMETEISGPLNTWIPLGGSARDEHSISTANRQAWLVEIKVELLP